MHDFTGFLRLHLQIIQPKSRHPALTPCIFQFQFIPFQLYRRMAFVQCSTQMSTVSARFSDQRFRFDNLQESCLLIPQITQDIIRSREKSLCFLSPSLLHQCIYYHHQCFFHSDFHLWQRKFTKQNFQAVHLCSVQSRRRLKQTAEKNAQVFFPPKLQNFQFTSLSEVLKGCSFKRSSAERASIISFQREGIIRNQMSAGQLQSLLTIKNIRNPRNQVVQPCFSGRYIPAFHQRCPIQIYSQNLFQDLKYFYLGSRSHLINGMQ